MTSLTEQLAALQKELIEAKMEHKDIDNLRANYEKYLTIRDEKQKLMEEMDAHIEKLYALMGGWVGEKDESSFLNYTGWCG